MQSKLQELTEKIYNEGIVKSKTEAEKIVADADTKAKAIIKEAEAIAKKTIEDAEKQADELKENTQAELKLASKQIINATKQSITDVITGGIVALPVKDAVKDKDFIKSVIEKIASNWKVDDKTSADLNIILPESQKNELDAFFKKQAQNLLKQGIEFNYSKGLKSGFQISPKDGGYKVSFSEEEFENYFKGYIRPKLVELLFGE
jgi:V/A-type H+/Na+-transporting ATPase subunit E